MNAEKMKAMVDSLPKITLGAKKDSAPKLDAIRAKAALAAKKKK